VPGERGGIRFCERTGDKQERWLTGWPESRSSRRRKHAGEMLMTAKMLCLMQLCNCVRSVLSKKLQPGLRGHHVSARTRHAAPFNEAAVDGILPDR